MNATESAAKAILAILRPDPQAKAHVRTLRRWAAAEYRSRRCARRALLLDDVVVDRLMTGIAVDSTKAERLEATRILTARGRSIEEISQALHNTKRAIERYRDELNNGKAVA